MSSGVDAGEKERCHLGEHLLIGQAAAGLGVLGLEQQVRKAARLGLIRFDVVQQLPYNFLRRTQTLFLSHSKDTSLLWRKCTQSLVASSW